MTKYKRVKGPCLGVEHIDGGGGGSRDDDDGDAAL